MKSDPEEASDRPRGAGHQLHQSTGAGGTDCRRVEIVFLADNLVKKGLFRVTARHGYDRVAISGSGDPVR